MTAANKPSPEAEALFNQAMTLYQSGQPVRALECFDSVLAQRPNAPFVHFYRGLALHDLRKFELAVASYDRAIALKPDMAEAHSNRGNALQELKRLQEAVASYDRAITLKPDFASAYSNRAFALLSLKMLDEALASADRALELQPDFARAYINRGSILAQLDRQHEALASYDAALKLAPDGADIYFARGLVLMELKRLDEASASYDRAIALAPDYAEAYWGKSHVSLLQGDYEEGWKLDEWRMKSAMYKYTDKKYPKPRWLGKAAPDPQKKPGTLLIYSEAGQGDAIQYCRYIPLLKEQGIKAVFEVQPSLARLMSTLDADVIVVERNKPQPEHDQCTPVGSLPLAFGTTFSTIPAKFPYLHADSEKLKRWQDKMGNKTKPRIGLAWSGQVNRRIDSSSAKNRSIPLHLLKPVLELPFEFHSLQKDIRPEDAATLMELGNIRDHRADLNDFSDTAALAGNLDLVVTIDTSVAHLAGAIGRKIWVMLPFCVDYRWTPEGTATPWYPGATLFRQPAAGDWNSVVSEIVDQLKKLA
jgi:tetratricopeptide (TPR) repeat protein